jgi:hypothetical protein
MNTNCESMAYRSLDAESFSLEVSEKLLDTCLAIWSLVNFAMLLVTDGIYDLLTGRNGKEFYPSKKKRMLLEIKTNLNN